MKLGILILALAFFAAPINTNADAPKHQTSPWKHPPHRPREKKPTVTQTLTAGFEQARNYEGWLSFGALGLGVVLAAAIVKMERKPEVTPSVSNTQARSFMRKLFR